MIVVRFNKGSGHYLYEWALDDGTPCVKSDTWGPDQKQARRFENQKAVREYVGKNDWKNELKGNVRICRLVPKSKQNACTVECFNDCEVPCRK